MELLHQDGHLIVVNKPAGMLVHQGWARDDRVAVTAARELSGRFVYPVHRLDRGASGALAFALDGETARALHEAFEDGRVDKVYLAVVRGVAPGEGVIDHPIPRREGGPRVPAVTTFRRLAIAPSDEGPRWSLVEARPRTGRLHQVRRHLKHISHPILGDANYGDGAHNRAWRARSGAGLALHALSLALDHPVTHARLELRALPRGPLATALAAMGWTA